MASAKHVPMMEARKHLPNVWRSDLMSTPTQDPASPIVLHISCVVGHYMGIGPDCGFSHTTICGGHCFRFTCCGGIMPCSGKCGESKAPQLCAATEAVLCFACSVSTTRYMLQDAHQIQNTKCDNCIIGTIVFLSYLNCICSLVACFTDIEFIDDAAIITDRITDIAFCSVCACMQTQHKLQMDERDGVLPPLDRTVIRAPPQQEMSYYR